LRFRYLPFDCYGTLIDWRRGIEESLEAAFGKLSTRGVALMESYAEAERLEEADYQKYREVLRRTALRLTQDIGVGGREESATRFAASVPSWPAFADSAGALRVLGAKGYRRYILSNVDTDLLVGTIQNNGLEVDGFVAAEEVGSYKPSDGHWVKFLEKTGASKEEVLHVTQSVFHDIVPAGRLGFQTAWVNRYGQALPTGIEPLYIADSLEGLASVLQ
jgi:2-haloalkanoic acid dehalogenase type II